MSERKIKRKQKIFPTQYIISIKNAEVGKIKNVGYEKQKHLSLFFKKTHYTENYVSHIHGE